MYVFGFICWVHMYVYMFLFHFIKAAYTPIPHVFLVFTHSRGAKEKRQSSHVGALNKWNYQNSFVPGHQRGRYNIRWKLAFTCLRFCVQGFHPHKNDENAHCKCIQYIRNGFQSGEDADITNDLQSPLSRLFPIWCTLVCQTVLFLNHCFDIDVWKVKNDS